jgi:hypothetical protein
MTILSVVRFGDWRAMTKVNTSVDNTSMFVVSHVIKDIGFYCDSYEDALKLAEALDAYALSL